MEGARVADVEVRKMAGGRGGSGGDSHLLQKKLGGDPKFDGRR
jgi:hypothetical protein